MHKYWRKRRNCLPFQSFPLCHVLSDLKWKLIRENKKIKNRKRMKKERLCSSLSMKTAFQSEWWVRQHFLGWFSPAVTCLLFMYKDIERERRENTWVWGREGIHNKKYKNKATSMWLTDLYGDGLLFIDPLCEEKRENAYPLIFKVRSYVLI